MEVPNKIGISVVLHFQHYTDAKTSIIQEIMERANEVLTTKGGSINIIIKHMLNLLYE